VLVISIRKMSSNSSPKKKQQQDKKRMPNRMEAKIKSRTINQQPKLITITPDQRMPTMKHRIQASVTS